MNGKFNVKTIINFHHTSLLLSVDKWPSQKSIFLTNSTSDLLLVKKHIENIITFSWSPFGRRSAMNSFSIFTKEILARTLKNTFSLSTVFFLSLHQTTTEVLAFVKATIHAFVISTTCAFSVDLLANF